MYPHYDLYEDDESIKMMALINENADREYEINKYLANKENKKKSIMNFICVISSIILFIIVIAWVIVLNQKLNQEDMDHCLKNNTHEFCQKNVGWGVK